MSGMYHDANLDFPRKVFTVESILDFGCKTLRGIKINR